MSNITLCTKINLLFLFNIELNTNDTQMNENLFSIISSMIKLKRLGILVHIICILNYNMFLFTVTR